MVSVFAYLGIHVAANDENVVFRNAEKVMSSVSSLTLVGL